MIARWTDADDRLLARALFGTDDAAAVADLVAVWTARHGLGPGRVEAIELGTGAAITVRLADRPVVVKAWGPDATPAALAVQLAVQDRLARVGFPAPALLARLQPLGRGWAAAMAHDRTGKPTDARLPGVRAAMAAGLARQVAAADGYRDLPGLPRRSLPVPPTIWPAPHNALFDFAATAAGAEWIDALAADALAVLHAGPGPLVVGHCNWRAGNMRMGAAGPAVVYDWDSLFLEREALVVGTAAAHFPLTAELPVPETPAPAELAAFVRDYQATRGRRFTAAELTAVAAGATYARAYKARCEHALDPARTAWAGSAREALATHGPVDLD